MPDMKNPERVWPEPTASAFTDDADIPRPMIGGAYGVGREHPPARLLGVILTLTPDDVAAMSKALGDNIQTPEQLVSAVQKMSTIRVHNVEVVLEPGLLHRLKSRCLVPNFSVWLRDQVLRWAHNEVGW